ncbi:MAG: 30S ribosomal protein S12 methylthiotransferase RimO [Candidatus Omnitrophica bacterium]|nr:30S ribosomal protein S12 methylthiotransferase RimO [Candidatus Omnitrophota bacterium]
MATHPRQRRTHHAKSAAVAFISLGCPRNLVDSEILISLIKDHHYRFVEEPEQGDIIIINTCTFIQEATEETIDVILKAAALKKQGRTKGVIVYGCFSQRYKDRLRALLPEVDAFLGVDCFDELPGAIEQVLQGKQCAIFSDHKRAKGYTLPTPVERSLTQPHIAYLKISEGCLHRCTFCVIPDIKGPHRSRRMEEILKEGQFRIREQSVSELVIIAQDTSTYGIDLYYDRALPRLLRSLAQMALHKMWIRVLYLHPEGISDELLRVFAEYPQLCRYIDIPIEHASDHILKRMGRTYNRQFLYTLIRKIRDTLPGVFLRSSVIVGFPGESEEDFEELRRFIADISFERLGAFMYSKEEGAAASLLENQIPEKTKQRRLDEVMRLQQEISRQTCARFMGSEIEVLVDDYVAGENLLLCRSEFDAPEVDGLVLVKNTEALPGEFITVRLVDTLEYDLIGERVR